MLEGGSQFDIVGNVFSDICIGILFDNQTYTGFNVDGNKHVTPTAARGRGFLYVPASAGWNLSFFNISNNLISGLDAVDMLDGEGTVGLCFDGSGGTATLDHGVIHHNRFLSIGSASAGNGIGIRFNSDGTQGTFCNNTSISHNIFESFICKSGTGATVGIQLTNAGSGVGSFNNVDISNNILKSFTTVVASSYIATDSGTELNIVNNNIRDTAGSMTGVTVLQGSSSGVLNQLSVSGNLIKGCTAGIAVTSLNTAVASCGNFTITGNNVNQCTSTSISVVGPAAAGALVGLTVIGNTIFTTSNGPNTHVGLTNVQRFSVNSNTVSQYFSSTSTSPNGTAIYIVGFDGGTVNGNTLYGNLLFGIVTGLTSHVMICGNYVNIVDNSIVGSGTAVAISTGTASYIASNVVRGATGSAGTLISTSGTSSTVVQTTNTLSPSTPGGPSTSGLNFTLES